MNLDQYDLEIGKSGTSLVFETNVSIGSGTYSLVYSKEFVATEGMLIDLTNGQIFASSFQLDMEGNALMKGTIEAEAGKLANFFISKAHLGDKEQLTDSFFGLANPTIMNKGNEINAIYGRKEFDDNKQPTGTSRITIFAGAAPSSEENAARNAEINTKGSSTDEPKNGIPYYVTVDGFLKANNIYSRGSIVNETDDYRTALYEGQVIITGIGTNTNAGEIKYTTSGIWMPGLNGGTGDERIIEYIKNTGNIVIPKSLFIDGGLTVNGDKISAKELECTTLKPETISGGTISGATISGGTISGTTISGTTISGATIKIGNQTYSISVSANTIDGNYVFVATRNN